MEIQVDICLNKCAQKEKLLSESIARILENYWFEAGISSPNNARERPLYPFTA